jgi:arylsulfatase A-like enzyme
MMKYMDKKVGQILAKIKAAGLAYNTLIVYAGDNGTPQDIFFDAHGVTHIQGEKGESLEGGTHVPLITYWPGHVPKSTTNNDLVDFTDFFPTFAEAAGITDLSAFDTLDGLSFYSRMLGISGPVKSKLFFHYCANPGLDGVRRWVRDKKYKLYGNGSFFNIDADEEELQPLADPDLTRNN